MNSSAEMTLGHPLILPEQWATATYTYLTPTCDSEHPNPKWLASRNLHFLITNGSENDLTLFYTCGLGIVVSHVMVPLPYRISLCFFT
jgi:hypothetical protein